MTCSSSLRAIEIAGVRAVSCAFKTLVYPRAPRGRIGMAGLSLPQYVTIVCVHLYNRAKYSFVQLYEIQITFLCNCKTIEKYQGNGTRRAKSIIITNILSGGLDKSNLDITEAYLHL
ncbi:hypothetical protein Plhal703r1_c01g0006421 [Plasmopara halstedii]